MPTVLVPTGLVPTVLTYLLRGGYRQRAIVAIVPSSKNGSERQRAILQSHSLDRGAGSGVSPASRIHEWNNGLSLSSLVVELPSNSARLDSEELDTRSGSITYAA